MLEKLGGRKFLAFLILMIAGIAVHLLSAKGVTTEFSALLLGAAGIFSAANTVATKYGAAQEVEGTVTEVNPGALATRSDHDDLAAQVQDLQGAVAASNQTATQALEAANKVSNLLLKAMGGTKPQL